MPSPYTLGSTEVGELKSADYAAGFSNCYVPDIEARNISLGRKIVAGFVIAIIGTIAVALIAFGVVGLTCLVGLGCMLVGG